MITVRSVRSEVDVQDILNLQYVNLKQNVPIEQHASEGFVTLQHSFDLLNRMNQAMPSIIARTEHSLLIGYTLSMLPCFADEIPALNELFAQIQRIHYKDKLLSDYTYYVMGQACVCKGFRGQKLLAKMLNKHRELYHDRYQLLITSIAEKNPRSIVAHCSAGFTIVCSFSDAKSDEIWYLLVWDWNHDNENNLTK